MATTTNFGWETPDDTDLVKDGAAAIRTALNGVDTSFVDLKGGTTGQVLAKASNTNLDFVWSNDSGISPTIVDAKGDLIAATAADTVARLAVGTNGQVLTADSTAATGIKWATAASGGLTSIASGSLSGTSVSITSISGSYKQLQIHLYGISLNTTGNIQMQFNSDTGNNYSWALTRNSTNTNSTSGIGTPGNAASIQMHPALEAGNTNAAVVITLPNYTDTTSYKLVSGNYVGLQSTGVLMGNIAGSWGSTSAITSIQLKAESTYAYDAGTYVLYGVN